MFEDHQVMAFSVARRILREQIVYCNPETQFEHLKKPGDSHPVHDAALGRTNSGDIDGFRMITLIDWVPAFL